MSAPYSHYPIEWRYNGRVYMRAREAAQLTGYQPFTLKKLASEGKVQGVQRNRVWYVYLPSVKQHNATRRFAIKEQAVQWLVAHKDKGLSPEAAVKAMADDGLHLSRRYVQKLMRKLGMTPPTRATLIYRYLKAHPDLRQCRVERARSAVENALGFPVSIPDISYGWRRVEAESGHWPDFNPAEWMTIEEAAQALGVVHSTVQRRARAYNWLTRRGPGRRVYYYRAQIEAEAVSQLPPAEAGSL